MSKPQRYSIFFSIITAVAITFAASAFAQQADRPWMNPKLSPEERAEMVLKQMTLD